MTLNHPPFNTLYNNLSSEVGYIQETFPNAKIVVLVKKLLGVTLSANVIKNIIENMYKTCSAGNKYQKCFIFYHYLVLIFYYSGCEH